MARILRTYYSATDEGIEVYRVLHAARRREDLL